MAFLNANNQLATVGEEIGVIIGYDSGLWERADDIQRALLIERDMDGHIDEDAAVEKITLWATDARMSLNLDE